jgi:ComF family protein
VQVLSPLRHLIDFCYPPVCAICRGPGRNESPLCGGCFDELRKLEGSPACDRCAMPVAQFGAPCPHCYGEGLSPFEGILRLCLYREPVRGLIHQIKYHSQWTLAEMLADRLLEQKPVQALLEQTDVIVPVPLHPWRQMIRGFNQAEIVARRIASRARIRLRRPLVRLKATETQTHLHSKARRMDNLRDAFGLLRPNAVTDKHVVVIDDVTTTGATLHHAGKCLKEAEPASLCAIVVAVADPQGRDFEAI